MPKVVVPEERRRLVSDAVARITIRTGVEGASLRNLAEETGLSVGSIRHYFESHDEILVFTMRELGRRIRERAAARVDRSLAAELTSPVLVASLLAELLPLTPAREKDMAVWLAFVAVARTRPDLNAVADAHNEQTRRLIRRVLAEATDCGGLQPGLDLDLECFRLNALLDGLTSQAVLHPRSTTPELLMEVLRRNVHSLFTR